MNPKRQTVKEGSAKVPAYIVTFSDMVTLLLTFFVMLLTMSNTQDPELFNMTQNAFVKYIKGIGLGMLLGRKMTPNLGNAKIKYFIGKPDKLWETRSIDAKEEQVRRLFNKLTQSMESMPSQIVSKKTSFSVTNISFLPGDASLNEQARKFLTQFALDLQQTAGPGSVKLYILGLAGDETTEKKQWILSAKRAQAVADFLSEKLPLELRWPVYSWGAGPGGYWIAEDSLVSRQSQILIAVLRAND